MRGLRTGRTAAVVIAGHAFMGEHSTRPPRTGTRRSASRAGRRGVHRTRPGDLTDSPATVQRVIGCDNATAPFQASLALALAVVDLAGRAGGRVDALFLDEGFGSLDANALADSLDTLSRQTLGGRLVAVISHMRAVAENIEHVLLVKRTVSGSQAWWASATERDQIVDDNLSNGLLP